jgi:hypothetical protein
MTPETHDTLRVLKEFVHHHLLWRETSEGSDFWSDVSSILDAAYYEVPYADHSVSAPNPRTTTDHGNRCFPTFGESPFVFSREYWEARGHNLNPLLGGSRGGYIQVGDIYGFLPPLVKEKFRTHRVQDILTNYKLALETSVWAAERAARRGATQPSAIIRNPVTLGEILSRAVPLAEERTKPKPDQPRKITYLKRQ